MKTFTRTIKSKSKMVGMSGWPGIIINNGWVRIKGASASLRLTFLTRMNNARQNLLRKHVWDLLAACTLIYYQFSRPQSWHHHTAGSDWWQQEHHSNARARAGELFIVGQQEALLLPLPWWVTSLSNSKNVMLHCSNMVVFMAAVIGVAMMGSRRVLTKSGRFPIGWEFGGTGR